MRDPEPQPEPTVVPFRYRALETTEDPVTVLGRNADAVVPYRQPRQPVRLLDGHLDGFARTVLDGVGNEIRDDLVDAHAVPVAEHLPARLHRYRASGAFELLAEAVDEIGRANV